MFVHTPFKQSERLIIIIIYLFFVGNHLWVNICLRMLPSSGSIKNSLIGFINDVFGIHLTSCVSPNALFRVHESRMWLTLCMIISPQLHWSVNKSVLSVCPCVWTMWTIKWDIHFLKASVPTTLEKGVHCMLVYKAQKELEWMTDSDRAHSASI